MGSDVPESPEVLGEANEPLGNQLLLCKVLEPSVQILALGTGLSASMPLFAAYVGALSPVDDD